MTCPRCSYPGRPSDRHCVYCGASLTASGEAALPEFGSEAGGEPMGVAPPIPNGLPRPSLPAPAASTAPSAQRQRASQKNQAKGGVAGLLALLAVLLKPLKGLLVLGKFKGLFVVLQSGGSMLVSMFFWAMMFPFWFAVGFVILLFIHEMGHAFALRAMGVPFSAPIFIPFMGAVIGMKEMPKDAGKEAMMAYAGPLAGTFGAMGCLGLYYYTGQAAFLGLAQFGFFLNLFNLVPVSPLDGGRIVGAISPKIWLVALPLLVLGGLAAHSFIMLLIAIVGFPRAIAAWKGKSENAEYFQVSSGFRILVATAYVGLGAYLAYMMYATSAALEEIVAARGGLGS